MYDATLPQGILGPNKRSNRTKALLPMIVLYYIIATLLALFALCIDVFSFVVNVRRLFNQRIQCIWSSHSGICLLYDLGANTTRVISSNASRHALSCVVSFVNTPCNTFDFVGDKQIS